MYYKKGVIGFAIVLSICGVIILGSSPLNPAECAEQVYDVDACVSMELSAPIVRSQEISIFSFDGKGIMEAITRVKYLIIAPYIPRESR